MVVRIINRIKKILFRIRWLTMSDRDRYAYLWSRTRNSLQTSSMQRLKPCSATWQTNNNVIHKKW